MSLLFGFAITLLVISCFLCLYRIAAGPTAADRAVGIDIMGTLIVGFTCVYALMRDQGFYMTVALSWALLSFIGTIALAKYLEGRAFHE